jgi:hypothetical protein
MKFNSCVTSLLLLLVTVSVCAASPAQIVGSWKSDDGRNYSEIHFRPDHSFTHFSRISMKNPTLILWQMAEQSGVWSVEGERLKLDSMRRGSNERSQNTVRFRVANHTLTMQNFYDRTKTDNYRRLSLRSCAETAVSNHPFNQQDLIGRWRGHYRTHETEFSFQRPNHVTFYSWDLGDRLKFSEATWRLIGNTITINPPRSSLSFGHVIRWKIIRAGGSCVVVSDGSSMSYTLQRVE